MSDIESDKPSFIVTGASASGKTTLIEEALAIGYTHLPTHTTRPSRPGETDGVHSMFISEDDIKQNFEAGDYIEDDLDYMKLHSTGVYYGTPRLWLDVLKTPEKCATPVAIKIARQVFVAIQIEWVHLVCDDTDRLARLKSRGIDEQELIARMVKGESVKSCPLESTVFNTSQIRPKDILKHIERKR